MSVYLIGKNPLPELELIQGQPCNRVDDGPNGWSRFVRTADGGPNAGLTLCATNTPGTWKFIPSTDDDNGQWCIVNGTVASFNPEPGGPVQSVFAVAIPNA